MGFDEDRFVASVTPERKCTLCRGVLDNPLATPCEHVFCSGCILPWVVQYESCPKKCGKVLPGALKNVLALRHNILNMDVRCDYHDRGCAEVVSLAELHTHVQECDYRPVRCRNKGCPEESIHAKDLPEHESAACEYRPVGICQAGCGLVLLHRDASEHDCLAAMKEHSREQEARVTCTEHDLKKLASKFSKREKSLLAQIASLHSEIQMQALRFQKKLTEYRAQITYLSRKAAQSKLCEENRLNISLMKEEQSLGFNIMGGYNPDSSLSDGIVVSRITENGPADRNGMQIHDQILQVNGQDLSKSTHEEAVEAFRTAREPIVVEVLRRVSNKNNKMKTRVPPMVSVSTQTDDYIDSPSFYGLYRPPTPPPALFALNGHGSLCQPSSRQPVAFSPSAELGLTDLEIAYDDSYDDDRTFDMEYEEVILHRLSADEKVGLTLCYGSADEDMTDIYISEIEPYSIAAHDGRIREGDQILQINGVDVHSRDQAIRLFAENTSDICLLVARPHLQMDDGFLDEGNLTLDELHMEMLEKQHHRNMALLAQAQCDEEGGTTDTATTENSCTKHEKDSGVGRTDESTRNDESSEQEIMENDCISPSSQPKFRSGCNLGSGELHFSNDSFTSTEAHDIDFATNEISAEECDKFREVLENRCSSVDNSPSHHQKASLPRKDSESSIEREIAILNKEVEDIQMECQSIVEAHMREQNRIRTHVGGGGSSVGGMDPFRSPRMVPRMGTRLDYAKQVLASQEQSGEVWARHESPLHARVADLKNLECKHIEEKDTTSTTTSAYNTGESCRSTPLTLELNQVADDSVKGKQSSMLSLATSSSQKPSHSDSDVKLTQTTAKSSTATKEWNSDGDHHQQNNNNVKNGVSDKPGELTKSQSSGSVSRMSQTQNEPMCMPLERDESLTDLYAQYADVMYTNKANLEHTMMVQQKLFEQQMLLRGGRRHMSGHAPHSAERQGQGRAGQPDTGGQTSDQQMEWVVKRRADGSRYITRRPIRNRLLKERAKKINEERCGLTTDDDAMSELKVGKYWTKEDKKKHMERARDQKRKREFMMRQRMETLKEKDGEAAENKKELNIVELSHRKMMKHKGKKVFDDFTTVQEMLAHGARVPEGKTYNPLLSVTTV